VATKIRTASSSVRPACRWWMWWIRWRAAAKSPTSLPLAVRWITWCRILTGKQEKKELFMKKSRTVNNNDKISATTIDKRFFKEVALLIQSSRQHVINQVNITMVLTYFEIGKRIVEKEQQGAKRAEYGKYILQGLSDYLTTHIGKGYSPDNLKLMRKFYLIYSENQIGETLFPQFKKPISETLFPKFNPNISWSHYIKLMRISNVAERQFYEIEIVKNNWSFREFERQFDSSLYERLALSNDKDKVVALSQKGQIVEQPKDIIKSPIILEFLGLHEKPFYSENDLESAIISNLQMFLLELGNGFLFEARQKRFTFEEKHFFVDLVFYNRLLQCYVLIDLKTGTLRHQDLGQIQMYVNYYDRYVKQSFEKPTIGILLCKEKDDNIVELTLSKEANIYASEYNLYLPDKALLQQKMQEWADEFEKKQIDVLL
jgi:predicted nuclease of restriction endonuclease-like (RecB) superfamily